MSTTPHKYAVIDTETSHLFDFSKPADAEGQPRLANFAVVFVVPEGHPEGAPPVPDTADMFVAPDGWEVHPDAARVNGLTPEILAERGRPVREVLDLYSRIVAEGWVIATWNAQFDTKVMRGELRRAGMPDLFESTPNVCLMRAATPVCCIPSKKGNGFKFPKLAEACAHFKIAQDDQHTALGDARAAASILQALSALGKLPEPEVHYAVNKPTSRT